MHTVTVHVDVDAYSYMTNCTVNISNQMKAVN